MKSMAVAVVIGAVACSKPAPPVPWVDQPLKVITGTVARVGGGAPLAWSISAPTDTIDASGTLKIPELEIFHPREDANASFQLRACDGAPGEDPTVEWRKLYGANAQPTADGFEIVHPDDPKLPTFEVDVIHVKASAALCCHAAYVFGEPTDRQKAALRAMCASAKLE